MFTTNATITDLIIDGTNVWIQFTTDDKPFPLHCEFNTAILSDISKLLFIVDKTKAKNVNELLGKNVRIIDNEEVQNSMIAIGSSTRNRFVDINGSEFAVSERRIYNRYKRLEKRKIRRSMSK